MNEAIDTLRVSGVGVGGWWLSASGVLSDVLSILVGCATLVYIIVKIIKEPNSGNNNRV